MKRTNVLHRGAKAAVCIMAFTMMLSCTPQMKVHADERSATITDVTVSETVGSEITDAEFTVNLFGDGNTFVKQDTMYGWVMAGNSFSSCINLPKGLEIEYIESGDGFVTFKISGTPAEASNALIAITIPRALLAGSSSDLTVTANPNARWAITDNSSTAEVSATATDIVSEPYTPPTPEEIYQAQLNAEFPQGQAIISTGSGNIFACIDSDSTTARITSKGDTLGTFTISDKANKTCKLNLLGKKVIDQKTYLCLTAWSSVKEYKLNIDATTVSQLRSLGFSGIYLTTGEVFDFDKMNTK